jgi:phage pi2 protein 07
MSGLKIDIEIADKITLTNLLQHHKMIDQMMVEYEQGGWMHPEDVVYNKKLRKALARVIYYFGGADEL